MEAYLFYRQEKNLGDSDIGFSVAIDFIPTEELGRKAALALLGLTSIVFHIPSIIAH
mgnify:CR=1 FL=1